MVAIKAHEADRALAAPDPSIRLFLFYGPDQGLIGERAQSMARSSVSDPADPFQLVRLDGTTLSADPMRLVDEANTIGLFGGKRAILVSSAAKCPVSAIEPVLSVPPIDAIVVLEAGDLARTSALRIAVERSRHGMAVPCYADETRGLDAVIDLVLRDYEMSIDRDARQLLSARIGIDRRVSQREIEKVATYAGQKSRIELSDVDAIVGDASARDIDDITDGVFSGSVAGVDLAFRRLCRAGEDPGVLLGLLSRHAQVLLSARLNIDAGRSSISDTVKNMRGITYPRRAAIESALNRWSSQQLIRSISSIGGAIAQVRLNPALSNELATRVLWNVSMSGGRS